VIFVALGVGGWGYVRLPILGFDKTLREHHRDDYVISGAGASTS
jgi:hypothetical protein